MKKIIMFALIALFIGGFTANANAQDKTKKTVTSSKVSKITGPSEKLADYKNTVNKCVQLNKEITAKTNNNTIANRRNGQRVQSLKELQAQFKSNIDKAVQLKKELEQEKLTEDQKAQFEAITENLKPLL